MSQIVQPHVRLLNEHWGASFVEDGLPRPCLFSDAVDKSRFLTNRRPGPLDIYERLSLCTTEDKTIFCVNAHAIEQRQRSTVQGRPMNALLFCVCARLDPDALLE